MRGVPWMHGKMVTGIGRAPQVGGEMVAGSGEHRSSTANGRENGGGNRSSTANGRENGAGIVAAPQMDGKMVAGMGGEHHRGLVPDVTRRDAKGRKTEERRGGPACRPSFSEPPPPPPSPPPPPPPSLLLRDGGFRVVGCERCIALRAIAVERVDGMEGVGVRLGFRVGSWMLEVGVNNALPCVRLRWRGRAGWRWCTLARLA
eukprot:56194-Chlamydomonas_euryale.AAC.7